MDRVIRIVEPYRQVLTVKKKAAAYARVSSDKDSMLHSLSAQVSYYSDMIQKHPEWEYVGVYADKALTGTKDNRLEFQRMLGDCRSGRIDLIITKSISRFARNTVTMLTVVRELKLLNIDVFFEKENIHTLSGDGEFFLTILASFAQAESLSVSENCKWRIRNGFAQGELVNMRYIYGYQVYNGELVIHEEQAKIVKSIFYEFLSGKGAALIAKGLNQAGIPTYFEKTWSAKTITSILHNEKYTGNAILQKSFRENSLTKRRKVNRGELKRYYVTESHPGIIDPDTFERVQIELQKRAERYKADAPKHSSYPFTGKIVCAKCGKHYKRRTLNANNPYRRVYWNCSTYLNWGKDACYAKQIPEDLLERITAEVLGIDKFDGCIFEREIKELQIAEFFKINYIFHNGKSVVKEWSS